MRRVLLASGILLLLLGCTKANTAFEIRIAPSGQDRREELLAAAARVVERRVQALGKTLQAKTVTPTESGAVLRFALPDTSTKDVLATQLAQPIDFRVMVEAPAESADVRIDQIGNFKETGITEKVLQWIAVLGSPDGKTSSALLVFTPQGRGILENVFKENQGKQIAIFVRGRLITRKIITPQDQKGSMQIDGIPNPTIASIFADDVNVGTYVTFTPLNGASGVSSPHSTPPVGSVSSSSGPLRP